MSRATQAVRSALLTRKRWLPTGSWPPAQVVTVGFAMVIAVATALLSLPAASADGKTTALIDAFFTAASATCVTGLSVVDTGSHFSRFGQVVILCCIQLGGLGLMVFTTVFLVATGRRLAITHRIVIQDSFHHSPTGKLSNLVLYITVATFATEAAGTVLLGARWLQNGEFRDVGDALYAAVFHSVSAFCNAGFSLYPQNLVHFRQDPFVLIVLGLLIIAGGLGFLVGLDIKEYLQQRFAERTWSPRVRERVRVLRPRPRLSLHSRLVLTVTGALLLIGTVSYYALERTRALGGIGVWDAAVNAWFCSVTARTAGFNTVDYGALGAPALLCTMVLMFIGGSPGSAAGGVKTSTIALLALYGLQRWRGNERVHVFGRSVPRQTLDRAYAVVLSAVAVVIVAGSALMAIEGHAETGAASQSRFLPVMFETFSAFGTVGLSMGFTASLSTGGKLIVAGLMFAGRVGPLTLALALGRDRPRQKFTYAEENVMVG